MGFLDSRRRRKDGKCGECGKDLVDDGLDCSVDAGPNRVRIKRLPVRSCPTYGHDVLLPPGIHNRLVHYVFWEGDIPVTFEQPAGEFFCRTCRKPVEYADGAVVHLEHRVRLEGLAPFELIIDGPGIACPSCGLEQVWSPALVALPPEMAPQLDVFNAALLRSRAAR